MAHYGRFSRYRCIESFPILEEGNWRERESAMDRLRQLVRKMGGAITPVGAEVKNQPRMLQNIAITNRRKNDH